MSPIIEFQEKKFDVDEAGFIRDFNDFCPEWVEFVKHVEGIDPLTEEHWKVIDFLQDYYKKNRIAPMVSLLSRHTGFTHKHIYELFPSGPGRGACKMAGLPSPTGCI